MAASLVFVACASFSSSSDDAVDAGIDSGTDAGSDPATDAGDGSASDGSVASSYSGTVLADSPLLYLEMEETSGVTAASAFPQGFPGTILGSVVLGVPGLIGHGFGFDGASGERVQVDSPVLDFAGAAPYTLEAWVKLSGSDNGYRHVFTKDNYGTPREEYGMLTRLGVLTFERFVAGVSVYITAPITVGAWHHLVGTYDGMMLELYVDGVLLSTVPDGRPANVKGKPLLIGSKTQTDGSQTATIDEVAVYATALSSDRIKAHYGAAPH